MTPVASPHGTGRRSLTGWLARQGGDPRRERLFRLAFGGAFSRREGAKVLVLYESNRIAFSQVYPFLMYARAFAAHHDAQFRLLPTDAALKGLPRAHLEATHVIAQVWGIDHPERLEAVRARLQELPAGVQRIDPARHRRFPPDGPPHRRGAEEHARAAPLRARHGRLGGPYPGGAAL